MRKTIKKCCRDCVVAFLVISLFTSPVTISAGQDSAAGERRMSRTARQRLRTRITYSCTEKPIETVLMDLAEQAQVDIVKSPKVTGNVTVKVTDVPLEEALANILAAHDFTYIATEGMIRVVPLPEVAVLRGRLVTRIYQITYANANEVAAALSNFVSQQGRVALNKGTSHIIITDTEDKIKGIDKFIEQIDHMTPQVLVEVRIYDITSKEGFELGAEWAVGLNAPLKTTEHTRTNIDTDFPTTITETTTTVIEPSSTTFSETRTDETQPLDVDTTTIGGQRQTIFDEHRTDNTTYGDTTSGNTAFSENRTDTTASSETTTGNYRDADDGYGSMTTTGSSTSNRIENSGTTNSQTTDGWNRDIRDEYSTTTNLGYIDAENVHTGLITQTRNEYSETIIGERKETETRETLLPLGTYMDTTTERYTTRRRKPFVGASFDRATGGSLRFSLLNDMVDIDLALSILHQQVEAKLLANPRVLVLDNETANFEIIREIPYRELLQVAREDPITYTEFKNVGVRLKVTPHIARDGMIKLHIAPEFGVLVGLNPQGVPTVDTRRASTIALIKDGQTIVMGGLRKRQTTKDISKVPVLGDIPVIGGLFKSETESVEVNELVIFITTRIVTEPVLSEVERRQFEATKFASPGMTKMRLERNNQLKPTVDEFKVEELTELIDMLLQK